MNSPIFPLNFGAGEGGLLTAIVLGFLFGFALERGGFGNARKLAAQFYFYDMTVFKVMFTAILVAMVGLYTLAAVGLVDLSLLWINPTFLWAQVVGGFLLGVGFILSGLCPGTAVVSAVSGRWDAWMTLGGIFVGTFLFAVTVDWFPGLNALYESGSMDVSLLQDLFGLPVIPFVVVIVLGAGAAFLGAEKVEKVFATRHRPVELSPPSTPAVARLRYSLLGALSIVALLGTTGWTAGGDDEPAALSEIAPLDLADAIIASDPNLVIVDLRDSLARAEGTIPGAYAVDLGPAVPAIIRSVPAGITVVMVAGERATIMVPEGWPRTMDYRLLRGGFEAWTAEVLMPNPAASYDAESRALAARQAQISAYFTGAAVQNTPAAPPPPAMTGGGGAPRKAGGC